MNYFQDQLFEGEKLEPGQIEKGEYENCTFKKCQFQNTDLSGFQFIDCKFIDSDLTLVKLSNTLLRDVQFSSSKVMGIVFDAAAEFGLSVGFDACLLNNCSFYKMNLKDTRFVRSTLKEVDFTEANLTNACFDHCDLDGSIFDNTNLQKADLSTSFNYNIDLNRNKARHSKHSVAGGLEILRNLGLIITP